MNRAERAWRDRAACQGADPELFHAAEGERQHDRETRERRARAVCATCPVTTECLVYSLGPYGRQAAAGIWGGLNDDERKTEKRNRTRRGEIAA